MLSQVIAQVRALGTAVQRTSVPLGAAEDARAHVAQFLDEGPPLIESLRSQTLAFATTSEAVLQRVAQALQRGTMADAVVPELRGLAVQATQTCDQLKTQAQPVTEFRDRLSQDSAKLDSQRVEMRARLTSLAAQRDQLSEQAAQLNTRLTIINVVSIFLVLVKVVDELVSLGQSNTSTEGQLVEVNEQLAGLQKDANQLDDFIQQIAALRIAVEQLARGAQNLINVVNILAAQIGNEAAFADAATAGSAELFVAALGRIVEAIRQDAS